MTHYVYIIASNDGCVKIGYSRNPDKRLKNIQTANPFNLTLLTAIAYATELEARRGECSLRRRIQERYKAKRRGEWLHLPAEAVEDFLYRKPKGDSYWKKAGFAHKADFIAAQKPLDMNAITEENVMKYARG